jgi:hypothetical protein
VLAQEEPAQAASVSPSNCETASQLLAAFTGVCFVPPPTRATQTSKFPANREFFAI